MPDSSGPIYSNAWRWLRDNDIPNWVILLFTAIIWPVVLYFWHKRKRNNIPNLEVMLKPGSISYGNKPQHYAVTIEFTNHTGSVVYLTSPRLRCCSKLFPVPVDAHRDIAENSYHLKFIDEVGNFRLREVTLQTNNEKALTCIPVGDTLNPSFYVYTANIFRRIFRARKYFILEYTAMVGPRKYPVATIY